MPILTPQVSVTVSGVDVKVGDGFKTNCVCWFSGDGGVTARTFANVQINDILFFNSSSEPHQKDVINGYVRGVMFRPTVGTDLKGILKRPIKRADVNQPLTTDGNGDDLDGGVAGLGTDGLIIPAQLPSGLPRIVAPPTSNTSNGVAGQTAYDADYLYECYATNLWNRFAKDPTFSGGTTTTTTPTTTTTTTTTTTPAAGLPIFQLRSEDYNQGAGTWTDAVGGKVFTATGPGITNSGAFVAFSGAAYMNGGMPSVGAGKSLTTNHWVNFASLDAPGGAGNGVCPGHDGPNEGRNGYLINVFSQTNGYIQHYVRDAAGNQSSMQPTLSSFPINTWRMLTFVTDRATGTQQMYLDGVALPLQVNNPLPLSSTTLMASTDVRRLARADNDFNQFTGLLGNLSIYDIALSAGDVTALFAGTKAKYGL